jgi:hypothetical protein
VAKIKKKKFGKETVILMCEDTDSKRSSQIYISLNIIIIRQIDI